MFTYIKKVYIATHYLGILMVLEERVQAV